MLWLVPIILKLLDFLPEKAFDEIADSFARKRKIKDEFMQIYTSIERAGYESEVTNGLRRLKDFLQHNYKLLDEDEISTFYEKWLRIGLLEVTLHVDVSRDKHTQLMADLKNIKPLI